MTKDGVLACLKAQTYTQAEVRNLVKSIDVSQSALQEIKDKIRPKYLKKHDVYSGCVGVKSRPIVVIKILNDIVIGIPLSTTKDALNLIPSKSRFFGEGYFSNNFVVCKYEMALERFCGVFDNPKLVNKACRELKQFINNNI